MKYEVTIGIPVYNVGKYIRMTMESALAQTFGNIEFLVLDDCGTDGSMDIVREYQQNHPRGKDIRIVRQPQNGGIGRARNRIIEEAQGRYLFFLDADDTIIPNAIELLYENAVKYKAELVYGSYQRIEEFEGKINKRDCCYPCRQFLNEDEFAVKVYSDYGFLQATIWNILIRMDVLQKNQLRFKAINYWEDFTLTMDLPTYVIRVVLLPDITYHYFCRNDSLSNFQKRQKISKKEIMDTIQAVQEIKDSSVRIREKCYFPQRMQKVMITDFYIVCSILRNQPIIAPAFSKREIRDVMRSPLTIGEIIRFHHTRLVNVFLYLLGVLPPSVFVWLVKKIGKRKGFIL
ncbi:MAG: glycosyltransferase family 2 protein [Prevotella sp.]|nr:glycosyltransferase family 2 protein [Prevotella sp.]